jgi:hypothetical protein
MADELAAARVNVEGAAARCGVAETTAEVVKGRVVGTLVEATADADLVVLGSRRWGAIRRLALGSTTARVLRDAHCPVLVPPRTTAVPPVGEPAAEQVVAKVVMGADEERRRQLDKARRRDEENRERFAVRRAEEDLARKEAELKHELDQLEEHEDRAKRDIEAEWREEHWHRDPDRPPAWRKPPDG